MRTLKNKTEEIKQKDRITNPVQNNNKTLVGITHLQIQVVLQNYRNKYSMILAKEHKS